MKYQLYLLIDYYFIYSAHNSLNFCFDQDIPMASEVKNQQPPAQSPTKSERMQKKKKSAAFKTFLARSNEVKVQLAPTNLSDHQQNAIEQQQKNQCNICRVQLGKNRKYCGFCRNAACSNHLRKKRKNKHNAKFVRICDECQDKFLYEKYMKIEVKAQESLTAQQLILTGRHGQLSELVNHKRIKRQVLANDKESIIENNRKFLKGLDSELQALNNKLMKLAVKEKQIDDLTEKLNELQKSMPRPLDEDFNALNDQNNQITKQLSKYDKMCNEALQSKSKKQKQIYEKYYEWEQKQKRKVKQKNDDCTIY